MTTGHDHAGHEHAGHEHDRFDARLRHAHAQAVDSVSARTLLQLRPQRPAPRALHSRLHAWPLAATCAVALIAGGVFLRHPGSGTPPTQATAPVAVESAASDGDTGDVYATLDESPDLYLWLASNDTDNLVTE
ncbi:hypothetical protein [Lysobacter solisilvae (ex Woo and Kim 2020)]|uniref:Uncharacterized protein n=1 Tax=Agrilutibacter terrestris TaxID=2865112 RepID=A0A7H0FV00_9GAMM|nr:hypothetical protein [Lysobacter terrestris]QNP39866.1 hypothetical protein H8B22_10145 [Lysobacter terrestris]